MSDCSSSAMERKERRTCGNCNNCDFDWMECEYIEEDGTHRKVAIDTPACDDWEKCALTDDERYERLAQVAREMYSDVLAHNSLGTCGGVDVSAYEERLEALGVSVDD